MLKAMPDPKHALAHSQNTEHTIDLLSSKQTRALTLALQGLSDTAIARRTGVTRQTINCWRNQDPLFRAALRRERMRMLESQRDRLLMLVEQALQVISQQLAEGSPQTQRELAKFVLQLSGLRGCASADYEAQGEEGLLQFLSGVIGEVAGELVIGQRG